MINLLKPLINKVKSNTENLNNIGKIVDKYEQITPVIGNTVNTCSITLTEGIWIVGGYCQSTISADNYIIYSLAGCTSGGGTARGTMNSGGGLFSSGIVDATSSSKTIYLSVYGSNTGVSYKFTCKTWAIRIK